VRAPIRPHAQRAAAGIGSQNRVITAAKLKRTAENNRKIGHSGRLPHLPSGHGDASVRPRRPAHESPRAQHRYWRQRPIQTTTHPASLCRCAGRAHHRLTDEPRERRSRKPALACVEAYFRCLQAEVLFHFVNRHPAKLAFSPNPEGFPWRIPQHACSQQLGRPATAQIGMRQRLSCRRRPVEIARAKSTPWGVAENRCS